ncbi:hypothetical protein X777_05811 [Ooceraea biroi]|uniref:Uncharacterized protein n=1 Tax=Ooceraea biroi TaxID=2015173 RepID=A0A026WDC7_OOCBI|nr:hypothetical protein X777_05811 [Ooceraea biroi]
MARMLPVAHAARYACQATRNQARPRWGTIDKFQVPTSSRQVTTPLHYLRGRAAPYARINRRCRDQDATSARINARTASAATTARVAAIPDAKINAAANRAESARASKALAIVN